MKFTARFVPQAWVNDYAVDVDPEGPTEWDCTNAVSEFMQADGTLRSPFRIVYGDEYLDNDDVLKGDQEAPEWVQEWSGPFSIYVMIEEETTEEEGEPTEPEEGDYITKDYRRFYQDGKLVVSISQEEQDEDPYGWTEAVREHMEGEQFWPNVWLEGERGGYDLLSLEKGGFA